MTQYDKDAFELPAALIYEGFEEDLARGTEKAHPELAAIAKWLLKADESKETILARAEQAGATPSILCGLEAIIDQELKD